MRLELRAHCRDCPDVALVDVGPLADAPGRQTHLLTCPACGAEFVLNCTLREHGRGPLPVSLPLRPLERGRTARCLAELLGVARETVSRWRSDGVPFDCADRVAVRLGSHPAYEWPDCWEQRADLATRHSREREDAVA